MDVRSRKRQTNKKGGVIRCASVFSKSVKAQTRADVLVLLSIENYNKKKFVISCRRKEEKGPSINLGRS